MKKAFILLLSATLMMLLCSASGCQPKQENKNSRPAELESAPTPIAEQSEPIVESTQFDHSIIPGSVVKIKTKFGDMIVRLYDETPKHRDNFLKLSSEKFYDGLLFHRCIPGFMIQGGDPNSRGASMNQMLGSGGPGYTVPAEFNPAFIHKKGALCAARQGDQVNPTKASSGSQFYVVAGQKLTEMQLSQNEANIGFLMPGFKYTEEQKKIYQTIGGTAQLDMNYTVFGEVVYGLNIIDSVLAVPTQRDRPVQDIVMNVEILKKSK
jgi:cyclophilin family peptidyl-prolyl cis-trans isomerase